MADIRCPMCGTVNPARSQFCESCKARLPSQPGDAEMPDWLGGLRSDDSAGYEELPSQESAAQPGDMPDWLSRLGPPTAGELKSQSPFASDEPGASASSGIPDWLADTTPSAAGDPNIPDWMEELGVDAGKKKAAAPEDSMGDNPEWLARVRARRQSEFGDGQEESSPEQPAAPGAAPADIPDWLAGLGGETQPAKPAGEALPDWLSGGSPQPAEPASSGSLPDWLSELGPADTGAPAATPAAWETEADSQPFSGSFGLSEPEAAPETPAQEPTPDWISRLGGGAAQPPSGGSVPAFTPAFTDEDFGDLGESEARETSGEAALPDWVSQISADQPQAEPPKVFEPETGAGLTPAQLPSWLEAMRPVESAAPTVSYRDETDTHVESAGPLAGLRGVLPAEAEIARLRKPATYSVKLHVSEAQQAHIAMLETLIKSEGQPKPIVSQAGISALPLLRIAIALVLVLAVFWTLYWDAETVEIPVPNGIPAEVSNVIKSVQTLSENAPVLLAFDYEPGLSGEMDAAAKAVIEDMMGKRVYFALVSTSPTGPMMAEHLFGIIQDSQNVTYTNRTNLGYIPGGATGLMGFAISPRDVMSRDLNSSDPWGDAQPLSGINTVADFAMVVLITDNPDTARNWAEQVLPALGETRPFALIVSAQAEPLVRPYYEANSGQIGMVTGLRGSAVFEKGRALLGLTRDYWDSFSAVILATVMLILIGGLVNLLAAWLAGRKPKGAA